MIILPILLMTQLLVNFWSKLYSKSLFPNEWYNLWLTIALRALGCSTLLLRSDLWAIQIVQTAGPILKVAAKPGLGWEGRCWCFFRCMFLGLFNLNIKIFQDSEKDICKKLIFLGHFHFSFFEDFYRPGNLFYFYFSGSPSV